MASYADHLKAIQDFRCRLRRKVWTVDVVMADAATYGQLEDNFNKHSNYKRRLFKLKDENYTMFETFTSSQFGDRIITIGHQGDGFGTTYTGTDVVDPDVFDATKDATKVRHWGNN